ncbi:MAG: hypothetical protein A2511_13575 [Deltaproteobacteria bacterium RIFOXYD12_FULL_50_9]|nr:MAG: hypothetical protein A2511_13575 [Deltaproteobacteria bacterium RIFOXYD12_FULL_50_9]
MQHRRYHIFLGLMAAVVSISLSACSSTGVVRRIQADEWHKDYGMQTVEETTMPENIPKLLIALTSKNIFVQTEAANALGAMGPDSIKTAPALIDAAARRNSMKFNYVIAAALANMGKEVVPVIIPVLDHKILHLRKMAAIALGNLGPDAADAIQPLAQRLNSEKKLYGDIVYSLGKIGPESFDVLFNELKIQKNDSLKGQIIKAIGDIGPAAEPAIPVLLNYFQSYAYFRTNALNALLDIGYTGDDFIQAIINYLHTPDDRLKIMAINGLGRLGPTASEAVPDLMRLLAPDVEPDIQVRTHALNALLNIGYAGNDLLVAMTNYLQSPDSKIRIMAVAALGKIGPAASGTVSDLTKLLTADSEIEVRLQIPEALAKIDPAAKQSVPNLLRALSDENGNFQMKVLDALSVIADDNDSVTSAVQPFLRNENPNLRKQAMMALQNLNHTGEEFKKSLKNIAAEDSHPQNRLKATCILKSMSEVDGIGSEGTAGKAKIYFIRPRGHLESFMPFGIWDNIQYIGAVPNGSYIVYETEPGEHLFLTRTIEWTAVKAQLAGGREYFITLRTFSPGEGARARTYLVPLDACMAEEQIEKLLPELKESTATMKSDWYSNRYAKSKSIIGVVSSYNTGNSHFARMYAVQGRKIN